MNSDCMKTISIQGCAVTLTFSSVNNSDVCQFVRSIIIESYKRQQLVVVSE